jgi:hypothetical protein
MAKAWPGGATFIDASDLGARGSGHYLDDVAESARESALALVPATSLRSPPEYQAAVQRMATADQRGVALRVDLAEMTSASTWASSRICPLSNTDLVVDLRNGIGDVAALGISAANAFASLQDGSRWRSVTIAGGSIPQTRAGFKVGGTPIRRAELAFWRTLAARGLDYNIDFGDYASVAPDALTVEIPGPFPINVKYSLRDIFLALHGVRTKGPGSAPKAGMIVRGVSALHEQCWSPPALLRKGVRPCMISIAPA